MKEIDVFFIPELTNYEKNAVKACWAGEANEGQQRTAMNVVIDKLSMADFLPYQAGSFDQTAFLNGRIFVGKAVRRILKSEQENTQ
jgi:hypothetical protein